MPKSRCVKEFFFISKRYLFLAMRPLRKCLFFFIITGVKEASNDTRITKMQKSEYFTKFFFPPIV